MIYCSLFQMGVFATFSIFGFTTIVCKMCAYLKKHYSRANFFYLKLRHSFTFNKSPLHALN